MQKMFPVKRYVASNGRVVWGWLFLMVGACSFTSIIYAAVVSKVQPPFHNVIIRAIQKDWYYCFLVPLTLSDPFCCGVFSLAEHEIVQACLIILLSSLLCKHCERSARIFSSIGTITIICDDDKMFLEHYSHGTRST